MTCPKTLPVSFLRQLQLGTIIMCMMAIAGCFSSKEAPSHSPSINYPNTPKGERVDTYHGVAISAPYRWMENLEDDDTRSWVAEQNQVSKAYLRQIPGRGYFLDRLNKLLQEPPPGATRKHGRYWVTRQSYSDSLYRYLLQDHLDAPARVILDSESLDLYPDQLVTAVRVSPNGRYVAYTVSAGGEDRLQLRIRDLIEDKDTGDRISGLKFGIPDWTADSRGFVYWRYRILGNDAEDGIDRESFVAYHALGTSSDDDIVLVRSNPEDVGATTWSQVSDDGRFVVIFDDYGFRQRISIIDLEDPMNPQFAAAPVSLGESRDGDYTFAGSVDSTLYFRTTRNAPNGQLVSVQLDRPHHLDSVIPESEHLLEHALIVGGKLVVAYRQNVQRALLTFALDGTAMEQVPLPAPGSTFWHSGTSDSPILTFFFDAYAHPRTGLQYNVVTGESSIFAPPSMNFDAADYTSRQVFYESADGTKVPLFLTHRSDISPSSDMPTLLYGYGASGAVIDPIFADDWFTWIEAGGLLAVANVRGGGEYGEAWHRAGMLAEKQNTFDDFIAAAEYLVANSYTSPKHLAILGQSNGGMLVGAVMTQRPDLFEVAIPVVGVLDALRFPSFTAGPRWAQDMGDPAIEEQFEWLRAWSPLHQIRDDACYPATLVSTAMNDDLVHPSQSYKFAARLQAAQTCDRPTILRAYPQGGHRFLSDRSRRDTNADILAFAAYHTELAVGEQ